MLHVFSICSWSLLALVTTENKIHTSYSKVLTSLKKKDKKEIPIAL